MRAFLALAAVVALAACGSHTDEDTAPVTTESEPSTAMIDTVTPTAMAGTYEVTLPDGSVTLQTLSADGTYTDRIDGEIVDQGTWRQQGGQLCYAPEGEAANEQCYAGGEPGPDGAFEMRDDAGDVSATVRKIEVQPTA